MLQGNHIAYTANVSIVVYHVATEISISENIDNTSPRQNHPDGLAILKQVTTAGRNKLCLIPVPHNPK